jgi:hypothetical protein
VFSTRCNSLFRLQPPVYSCRTPATSEWETGSLSSSQNSNFSMLLLMPTSRGTCMRYEYTVQFVFLWADIPFSEILTAITALD